MLLGFAFDGIELADTLHNLMREARRLSGFGDLEVAAPRVRETSNFDDAAIDKIAIVSAVGVGLQIALPALEEGGRMLSRAISGELVNQQRFAVLDESAPHPQSRGRGLASTPVLPRQRRVVTGENITALEPLAHALDQGHRRLANRQHPIGERAAR